MSQIRANTITNTAGTGAPTFSNGIKTNAILDASGGNTATINGAIPAPATSPTLTTPIISGNLGAGGANYGTSGQVLTSGGAGASTSWSTISAGGMTLLGTLATTSGSTVTLSGLNLTSYKNLFIEISGVSTTSTTSILYLNGTYLASPSLAAIINVWQGLASVALDTGIYLYAVNTSEANGGTTLSQGLYRTTLVNASTSLSFMLNTGTFDAGSIIVYGVK